MTSPSPQTPDGTVLSIPGAVSSGHHARSWTLEMPAGMRLLSLNDRRHWAEKGRITRDLRAAACVLARQAKIPPLERASVTVTYQPPLVTRRRDLDNVATASGKPCIDGALRDAGVLRDDSPQYLTEVTYRIGEPFPNGRLVLTITEVAAERKPAAIHPPPHIQPKTRRECPYMAITFCNKCGWFDPGGEA